MAYLSESGSWAGAVYQIEEDDAILGGPPNLGAGLGLSNVAAQQLANRTSWLRSQIQGLIDQLDGDPAALDALWAAMSGKVPVSRTLASGTGLSGGGDLGADVVFEAEFASEGEALSGVSSEKVMTPLRTAQVIGDLVGDGLGDAVPVTREVTAGDGLSGGGDLSADRYLALAYASEAQATLGTGLDRVMSPYRTAQAIAARLSTGIAGSVAVSRIVEGGVGINGGGSLTSDRALSVEFASGPEAVAGQIESKAVSPATYSQAASSFGAGVGIGQSWQDVKGSRVKDTSYKNTVGRTIAVFVSGNAGDDRHPRLRLSDGASPNGWRRAEVGYVDQYSSALLFVPDGYYYQIVGNPNVVLELR